MIRKYPNHTLQTNPRFQIHRQSQDIEEASNSLFHIKMIANLEEHNVLNNIQGPNTEPHKQWEQQTTTEPAP